MEIQYDSYTYTIFPSPPLKFIKNAQILTQWIQMQIFVHQAKQSPEEPEHETRLVVYCATIETKRKAYLLYCTSTLEEQNETYNSIVLWSQRFVTQEVPEIFEKKLLPHLLSFFHLEEQNHGTRRMKMKRKKIQNLSPVVQPFVPPQKYTLLRSVTPFLSIPYLS